MKLIRRDKWRSFFTTAPNTCAIAPYITLTEAGADFEVRPLNFRKRHNFTPEYLKINPKHKSAFRTWLTARYCTRTSPSINGSIGPFPPRRSCPAIRGTSCRRSRSTAGAPAASIRISAAVNNPAKVCDAAGASDSVIKFATEVLYENFRDR